MYNLTDELATPHAILKHILRFNAKEYSYIILGQSGPTGKTWLYSRLKEYGFIVYEISENTYKFIKYIDTKNHIVVDEISKSVIIILNQLLRR